MSLRDAGLLDLLTERRVMWTHVHAVDNALSLVADPVMLGFGSDSGAEVVNKVVARASHNEATGVPALQNGVYVVVEYSELATLASAAGDNDDGPAFTSTDPTKYPANICSHLFALPFLQRAARMEIPYHVARKQVAQVHPTTGTIAKGPAIKLERFIFDAFARCFPCTMDSATNP
jgi:putative uridylyltransferase